MIRASHIAASPRIRRARVRWALCALCALSALCALHAPPAAPAAQEAPRTLLEEHWYTLEIAGSRAGWLVETFYSDGGNYHSEAESEISLSRGGVPIRVRSRSGFVETHGGEPVSMHLFQDMGLTPTEKAWRFDGNRVLLTTRQGDLERADELPAPEAGWLCPMEAHRLWLERFHAGDREIEVTVLEPDNGLEPIPQRLVCTGSEELELDGRLAEVSVWEVTLSLGQVDLKALRKATRDGTTVYEEISAPMLGRFVTRLATRAEALAAGAPPEIMVRAFVRPDRPLRRAAELRRLGLRLRVAEGAMPSLPSAGAQVVQAGDDPAAATLWIDVDRRSTAPAAEASDPSYLASSSMIAADDELVRELAAEAVRGADGGAASRAEAMRRFVQGHMSGRGLDTAFATASESARTRKGDCSEHAVLLCAMLRSQGIPARVAIGLVYAEEFMEREGIFGWHMWTQALLEGRWVDLDATFPGPYHAAHVLTAVTALPEGGLAAELATTLLLLGNLRIEVLDVPHE